MSTAFGLTAAGAPAGEPERLAAGADAHTISISADGRQLAYARLRTLSNIWAIPVPTNGSVINRRGPSP